jgi:hypothetical protein
MSRAHHRTVPGGDKGVAEDYPRRQKPRCLRQGGLFQAEFRDGGRLHQRSSRAAFPGQRGITVYSHSICSRGSSPFPAPALVRLGVAGLDRDALPPRSADTAHRFTYLRHRHRVSFLAAVPAHRG